MLYIEFIVDGEVEIVGCAESMHEVGKLVKRYKDGILKGLDVKVRIDGKLHENPDFMLDVRRVEKHRRTEWIENRIMGDMWQL